MGVKDGQGTWTPALAQTTPGSERVPCLHACLTRAILVIPIHPDQTDAWRLIHPDRLPKWIAVFAVMNVPGCTLLPWQGLLHEGALRSPRHLPAS